MKIVQRDAGGNDSSTNNTSGLLTPSLIGCVVYFLMEKYFHRHIAPFFMAQIEQGLDEIVNTEEDNQDNNIIQKEATLMSKQKKSYLQEIYDCDNKLVTQLKHMKETIDSSVTRIATLSTLITTPTKNKEKRVDTNNGIITTAREKTEVGLYVGLCGPYFKKILLIQK